MLKTYKTAHESRHQTTNQAHHTKDGCTQAHWIDKEKQQAIACIFGVLWYFANARRKTANDCALLTDRAYFKATSEDPERIACACCCCDEENAAEIMDYG
jgi:hypothetical protein